MAISISNDSKNTLAVTNEEKISGRDLTLDEADWTLDEAEGTLDLPGMHITKETKNTISITNENKV